MGLQDLNEELYKREGVSRPAPQPSAFDARAQDGQGAQRQAFQAQNGWSGVRESFASKHRNAINRGLIAAGSIIVIALCYFVFTLFRQSAFSSDHVALAVDGPSDVSGSEASVFIFTYTNTNRANLTDAELSLTYPENFKPDALENMTISGSSSNLHIGTIAGHSEGRISIHGKFYGSKGSIAYIKGVLRYKPDGVGSSFQADSQIGVTIQSPSIRISMEAPLEVSSGGVVEYRADYTNMSDAPFNNLRLKMDYPGGFHLQSADPKTSEGDSIWYVGNLAPGQSGSVRVTGTLDGSKNEVKTLRAHIGMMQGNGELLSYSDGDRLTKIVASPLLVQQTVNGLDKINANAGSNLNYVVRYRNDSDLGLRNVIITLEIQGAAVDFSRLQSSGGAFDSVRKVVTWKASDVKDLANLAPGKEGSVSVTVPVLADILVKTALDTNFVVQSIAKIDSPDIATPSGANKVIGSNALQVKINSGVGVQAVANYQDAIIPNIGANPPQIGQETTYTMHWTVSNTTNAVDNAIVTAYLPTGIRWTGKIAPASENVTYDARTNQIIWNLGNVKNNTGSLLPMREVLFQVGVTPQINQAGQPVMLLDETSLTAHDTFTGETLQSKTQALRVTIPQ